MIAALTLLPALLLSVGRRLSWPNRRTSNPESRLWHRISGWVVAHRWTATAGSLLVLLALASPVLGLRLGSPSNDSLASTGGPAGTAITQVERSGLGAGLTQPIEILTDNPARVLAAVRSAGGVTGAISPENWTIDATSAIDVWTSADASSGPGATAATRVRSAVEATGAQVGGIPAQNADFINALYGNA